MPVSPKTQQPTSLLQRIQQGSLRHFRTDLLAGLQVALIALPLSLGIALASGFPPVAGILTAIVGGLLVSRLSGSYVTINGPAAGLVVVILMGVETLGAGDALAGYRLTLAAIVCAGLLQVIFALARAGRLSSFFPSAAVHGMMAAIGFIIIVKQTPVLLGVAPKAKGILPQLVELPSLVLHANPAVALVGLVTLFTLLIHTVSTGTWKRYIPAPLLAVAIGSLAAWGFGFGTRDSYQLFGHSHALGAKFLLALKAPVFASLSTPDFSRLGSQEFLLVTITIALVASLETLLSASAVDRLDPERRRTDLDRDLLAMGVGTATSGLLGGLPMIAEIVRSSANVAAGARTGWSNFMHGAFILLAVLVFPPLLSHIPLSSLAALLVFTGYRLASPKEILKVKSHGYDQLLIFLTTVVMVLATDLLVGVASGVIIKVVLHVIRQVPISHFFRCQFDQHERSPQEVVFKVHGSLVFTNVLRLTTAVAELPAHQHAIIDLSGASFVDHTAMERLDDLTLLRRDIGSNVLVEGPAHHDRSILRIFGGRRAKA